VEVGKGESDMETEGLEDKAEEMDGEQEEEAV